MAYYVSGFGPMHQQLLAVLIWIPLQLAVFSIYPSFLLWQRLHTACGWAVNVPFIFLFALYNIVAHCAMLYCIVTFDLPPVPALFLSIEQVLSLSLSLSLSLFQFSVFFPIASIHHEILFLCSRECLQSVTPLAQG